jgi:hypothetical protein
MGHLYPPRPTSFPLFYITSHITNLAHFYPEDVEPAYQTTQHYNAEDHNTALHCHENFMSHIKLTHQDTTKASYVCPINIIITTALLTSNIHH